MMLFLKRSLAPGGGAEDIGQVFNVLWDLNIGL